MYQTSGLWISVSLIGIVHRNILYLLLRGGSCQVIINGLPHYMA